MRAKEREREREREREQVQEQHTQQRAATTLAIKAAYGFYDSINLKCSMPNNKIPLFSSAQIIWQRWVAARSALDKVYKADISTLEENIDLGRIYTWHLFFKYIKQAYHKKQRLSFKNIYWWIIFKTITTTKLWIYILELKQTKLK